MRLSGKFLSFAHLCFLCRGLFSTALFYQVMSLNLLVCVCVCDFRPEGSRQRHQSEQRFLPHHRGAGRPLQPHQRQPGPVLQPTPGLQLVSVTPEFFFFLLLLFQRVWIDHLSHTVLFKVKCPNDHPGLSCNISSNNLISQEKSEILHKLSDSFYLAIYFRSYLPLLFPAAIH